MLRQQQKEEEEMVNTIKKKKQSTTNIYKPSKGDNVHMIVDTQDEFKKFLFTHFLQTKNLAI